jgi:peptidoglycan hydrolase-like protein with peptidoglycan-binding domain
MRALRILGAALLLSALPIGAYAQTSVSSQDESALVAQITALEQEIQSLTSGSTAAPATNAPANPVIENNACPTLQENLSLGESGPDVSSLQVFLAGAGLFNGNATGYFGMITQAAVEQWQASNNIVAYGTPETTGYGAVGPRTRLAIESSCGQSGASSQNSCLPAQPPVSNCSTGWQPVAGANGCTAYYQCAVPIPGSATTTSTSATSSTGASQTCPVVPQPICNGTVTPYQTNSNGCVTSYECVL